MTNSKTKKQLLLVFLVLFLLVSLLPVSIFAHENKNVHPWIVYQAAKVWPNDNYHEIMRFLPNNFVTDNWDEYCSQHSLGNSIQEGSKEEDDYDWITHDCFANWGTEIDMDVTNFFHHYWDCDDEGDRTGLFGYKNAYIYAQIEYWDDKVKSNYKEYYNEQDVDEAEKAGQRAYYFLGRIAHLLADMSIPAHVHNDQHPHDDSYENYIFSIFNDIMNDFEKNINERNLPNYHSDYVLNKLEKSYSTSLLDKVGDNNNDITLKKLFWNLAQRTQYFPSNGHSSQCHYGNIVHSNEEDINKIFGLSWFEGWLPNPNDLVEINDCVPQLIDPNCEPYCKINDENCKEIGNTLMPLAIQYTAALYKLFWKTFHPAPQVGSVYQIDSSTVEVLIVEPQNPDRFPIESYKVYYKRNGTTDDAREEKDIRGNGIIAAYIDGLLSNEEYIFWAVAVDEKGNESLNSNEEKEYISQITPETGKCWVELNANGVVVSPSVMEVGDPFTISFTLEEIGGCEKTFEYIEVWIQDGNGEDKYRIDESVEEDLHFDAFEPKYREYTSYLYTSRPAGAYQAVVKGKVAEDDEPFFFRPSGGFIATKDTNGGQGCFRHPLNSGGWYQSQDFCAYNSGWGYHLAEDYVVSDGSELPVFAPADGVIKYVGNPSSYGWVVIIEHGLSDGSYVCSVHGHMRQDGIISTGETVKYGDLIGYLSDDSSENGGYNFTHLHFGIRKGRYTSSWVYWGYRPDNSVCGDWYDPSDFINEHADCGSQVIDAPDLIVTDISLNTSLVEPGDVIQILCKVKNNGNGDANKESKLKYWLSDNTTWSTDDHYFSKDYIDPLTDGDSDPEDEELEIPDDITPGEWFILFIADHDQDINESIETNNLVYKRIVVTNKPDLIVSDTDIQETSVNAGDEIHTLSVAKNIGSGSSKKKCKMEYYLSSNTTLGSGDINLEGGDWLNELSSGEIDDETETLIIPPGTSPGTWYILFEADAFHEIDESKESNNVGYHRIVVTAQPDLVVQNPSLSSTTVEAGSATTASCVVNNPGDGTASSSYLKYYLSPDAILDTNDTQLETNYVGLLISGATSSESASLNIPSTTSSGTWYILFVADATNIVIETEEDNNVGIRQITVTKKPDLIIQSQSVNPQTVLIGETTSASCTVKNISNSAASSSYLKYFLSHDANYSADDVYLGYKYIGSLASEATYATNTVLIIPSNTSSGAWYLLFISDANDTVDETNEDNNIAYKLINLVNHPDLIVYNQQVAPTTVEAGLTITGSCTVANQGQSDADQTVLKFYLSYDTEYDAHDIELGSKTVIALSNQSTSNAESTLTIPSNTIEGTWYVIFIADYYNQVTESGELNNSAYIEINVEPPLNSHNMRKKIGAGMQQSLFIQNENAVYAWGGNNHGQLGIGIVSVYAGPTKVDTIDLVDIDGGWYHTLGLKRNGTVWAWGDNSYKQLGDSTMEYSNTPMLVEGLDHIIDIASAQVANMALKDDGTVWKWGGGSSVLSQVSGLSQVKGVGAGWAHYMAIKEDGSLWSWGDNRDGQLGIGSNSNVYTPTQVNNIINVVDVDGGYTHSVALANDGAVWTWGANNYGQLGDGTNGNKNSPIQLLNFNDAVAVAAGHSYTLVLTADGHVWSFGENDSGQLGNNTTVDSNEPVQVMNLSNVVEIAAGFRHSLAVKEDGTVWAWGINSVGETTGSLNGMHTIPVQVSLYQQMGTLTVTITPSQAIDAGAKWRVDGGAWQDSGVTLENMIVGSHIVSFQSISGWNKPGGKTILLSENQTQQVIGDYWIPAGELTVTIAPQAAIDDGALWRVDNGVWHSSGTTITGLAPGDYLVEFKAVSGWDHPSSRVITIQDQETTLVNTNTTYQQWNCTIRRMAGGGWHSLALKNDGSVWAWGSNSFGQLGNNTNLESSTPVQAGNLDHVLKVAGGYFSSYALKDDGTVWAWGYNVYGQLGVGSTLDSFTPVQVANLEGVKEIAAGSMHAMALKDNGTVWVWGSNNDGQLGDNTTTKKLSPVQVPSLTDVIHIAAGMHHSLALKRDGTLWTWGRGGDGQLGNGTFSNSKIPVQVALADIKAIAAGFTHSAALLNGGNVYTWGGNTYGQLGDGTTSDSSTPVNVVNLENIIELKAGYYHNTALRDDGTIWVWGANSHRQLGNGTTESSSIPIKVENVESVSEIAAGGFHTMALSNQCTWWAWGTNVNGILGDGTIKARYTPVLVTNLIENGALQVIIAPQEAVNQGARWRLNGGVWHNSGEFETPLPFSSYELEFESISGWNAPVKQTIELTDSQVKVVNVVYTEQTGSLTITLLPDEILDLDVGWRIDGGAWQQSGTLLTRITVGKHMIEFKPVMGWNTPNNMIISLNDNELGTYDIEYTHSDGLLAKMTAGYWHNLALERDGKVLSWTKNNAGILGDGTTKDRIASIQVPGLTNIRDIAVGTYHSIFLKNDHSLWVCGSNAYGQLGNGSDTASYIPIEVPGMNDVFAITSSYYSTIVLKNDGTVWAWGRNNEGQLGDGTTIDRNTPVMVPGFDRIISVKAGDYHTMALQNDGTVWNWGANSFGQLGDGTTDQSSSPVQVLNLDNVIAIASGRSHGMALKNDGTVWVWGDNQYGQLGDGTNQNSSTPVQISGLTDVRAVYGRGHHCLALKNDNTLWAWGRNDYGQLGDGTTTNRNTPVNVLDNVYLASAGSYHSLALSWDGTARSWGINEFGQLGDQTTTNKNTPTLIALLKGDINADGKVDLVDSILALEVVNGYKPEGIKRGGDVNGDIRIGMEEAIYILQRIAELR